MNAEIITIGTAGIKPPLEDSTDSGSQFLSHELTVYGPDAVCQTAVQDEFVPIRDALRLALTRSELIVLCQTEDEKTGVPLHSYSKDAVCDLLCLSLTLHEESWERIREYYLNTCIEMPEDIQAQAMLPTGCIAFPNDHGITPGFAVTRYGQQILVLPSTPREMLPMFSDYVAPYLSNLVGGMVVSRTVGVFGLSEAVLTERLADLMSESNPGVILYAKDGEAILRVTAHASDRKAAFTLCDSVVDEIRRRIGVNVYGVDVGSLQKAVVIQLLDKQMKIATAESCTAGLLSGRLTEVSGISAVFECGVAAYSPEIKHNILGVPAELLDQYGAVSPEVASAMATGVRRVGNAALGVSITGVAGPDPSEGKPVGTVYIALADEKRVWVKKIDINVLDGSPDRESIRMLATSHALDLVRRYLEALPTVMAGGETLANETPSLPVIPHGKFSPQSRRFVHHVFPCKGDSKADVVRKLATLFGLVAMLILLLAMVYTRVLQPMGNQKLYDQLVNLYDVSGSVVGTGVDADYPADMLTQFYALYSRNSDVRGWVKVDDTGINYPVMQDIGSKFYANHNFDRQPSSYGVPYFSSKTAFVSANSVNRSYVIYGNNSGGGQMFTDLTKYYNNVDFLSSHALIEMNTIYKAARWKVFAVLIVDEKDKTTFDYTQNAFTDEADFLAFSGNILSRSLYSIPAGQADVQEGDSLLLLSTDFESEAGFGGARLVVAARAVRSGETVDGTLRGVTYNRSAIIPSQMTGGTKSAAISKAPVTTLAVQTTMTTTASSIAGEDSDTAVSTQSATSTTKRTTVTTATTTTIKTETEGPTVDNSSPQTTITAATTTTTSAGGSTTTTPPTDTTTTQPSSNGNPSSDSPPILAGTTPESEFLQNCRVIDTSDGNNLIQPSNKQELQLLLARVVKTEMGLASMMGNDLAAQKAQAIASYTYILYCNQTRSQPLSISGLKALDLYATADRKIYDAVGEVVGIKILNGQNAICAMYSAATPGVSAANHEVYPYGANLPYLQSVSSPYENSSLLSDWETIRTISMDRLTTALSSYFGVDTVYFEAGSAPFFVKRYDSSGKYVLETNAYYLKEGKTKYITGYQMRMALGASDLRSHAFMVKSSTNSELVLTVRGYGHGIGLSQWGAAGYANNGYDYRFILSHYYSITSSSSHRLIYPVW